MYRRSYYFYLKTNAPRQLDKLNQVHVDIDKFSLWAYLVKCVKHGHDLPYYEIGFMINKLFSFTLVFLSLTIFSYPLRKYYDFKDPLLKDKDDSLENVSAEATLLRLKYKTKAKDWLRWSQP